MSSSATYLTSKQASAIDETLLSAAIGYTLPVLMELAGECCASVIINTYPAATHRRVAVFCGPGNNGGDGLVCARHLAANGYDTTVVYPAKPKTELFQQLITLCQAYDVHVTHDIHDVVSSASTAFAIVVDAVFGFSFSAQSGIKAPYDHVIEWFKSVSQQAHPLLVSIDMPSGWNVDDEKGDTYGTGVVPDLLISLTAPKVGVTNFTGVHALANYFVPPKVAKQHHFTLIQHSHTGSGDNNEHSSSDIGKLFVWLKRADKLAHSTDASRTHGIPPLQEIGGGGASSLL